MDSTLQAKQAKIAKNNARAHEVAARMFRRAETITALKLACKQTDNDLLSTQMNAIIELQSFQFKDQVILDKIEIENCLLSQPGSAADLHRVEVAN